MFRKRLLAILAVGVVAVVAAFLAVAASGAVTNGGFESGTLSGWASSGNVGVYQTWLSVPAPEGAYYAVLGTENAGGPIGPGATLSQTITASAGSVIMGQAKWFGTDPTYDSGTVTISSGGAPTVVFSAFETTSATPWVAWTYMVPTAGDYTVTATIVNTRDNLVSSYLGIDAVTVSSSSRGGYCSVAGNTYPYTGKAIPPGTFLDLTGGQVANDANYKGAVPANYLQGLGITCDVLPGYVATGQTVGYFGPGDPGMYVYYKKAS